MEEEFGIDFFDEIKNIYKEVLKCIEKNKEINIKKNIMDIYCRDFELDSI